MKQFKLTFLLTILMSMVGVKALAQDEEFDDPDIYCLQIGYNFNSDKTELSVGAISCSLDWGKTVYGDIVIQSDLWDWEAETEGINIPESVSYQGKTYSVTSVSRIDDIEIQGGFKYIPIHLPNSLITIENGAFSGCSSLTSLEIPNSVKSIGKQAFRDCSGLTSITIPNSVTSIGDAAFLDCSSLTSVTIGNSVTSIGGSAFSGCRGLTSIEIPSSVTSIGSGAFYNTPWYNNQPDGLIYIGKVAYKYKGTMPDNTSITIKEGTLEIAGDAFYRCSGLTSIEIPNSVTSIGDGAFQGCSGLTSVTIGNSVTSIGDGAFFGCSGLTSIKIPNSVTSIGDRAFSGCSGLTSIEIPNSVTSIGYNALNETSWYNNHPDGLVYAGKFAYKYKGTMPANTSITIKDGTLGIAGGAFSGCTGLTSIEIPNSVTSIGSSAFSGCSGLTSIEIPNSVTSIGYSAFWDCTGLTSIEIPNSVTSIENQAFSGCSGLTSIEIPNSVTSIGNYVFDGCSGLTSIEIPNSVTSIGNYAFLGCTGLTSVTIKKETPLPIQGYTFSNRANATLYVPYGSTAAYEAANYWKEFKEIIEMPSPRCATPTISYKNGELTFDCETEGVKYVSTITAPESTEADGKKIDLSKSFRVSVYATKEGYTDSDIATQDINIRGIKGDVDGDGVVDVNDVQTTINIILKK